MAFSTALNGAHRSQYGKNLCTAKYTHNYSENVICTQCTPRYTVFENLIARARTVRVSGQSQNILLSLQSSLRIVIRSNQQKRDACSLKVGPSLTHVSAQRGKRSLIQKFYGHGAQTSFQYLKEVRGSAGVRKPN